MVRLSPQLSEIIRVVPSSKMLIGLVMNVEYKAISAEAGTAHGLSPVLAILDEVDQVRGPQDSFIEAIETAQGAHASPLLIAIYEYNLVVQTLSIDHQTDLMLLKD